MSRPKFIGRSCLHSISLVLLITSLMILSLKAFPIHGFINGDVFNEGEWETSDNGDVAFHVKGDSKKNIEERLLGLINEKVKKSKSIDITQDIIAEAIKNIKESQEFPNTHEWKSSPFNSEKNKEKQSTKEGSSKDETLKSNSGPFYYKFDPTKSTQSSNPHAEFYAVVEAEAPRVLQSDPNRMIPFNNYLNGIRYGVNPGPCPSASKACKGLSCNLQDYILALSVEGTSLRNLIVERANNCVDDTTDPLDCTGQAEVYDMSCGSIYIQDIVLKYISGESTNKIFIDFEIIGLSFYCSGVAKYRNLCIDFLGSSGGRATLTGLNLFIVKIRNPVEGKMNFIIGHHTGGMTIKTRSVWQPIAGTFNEEMPYKMDFVEHPDGGNDGDNGCRLANFFLEFHSVGPSDYFAAYSTKLNDWFFTYPPFEKKYFYYNSFLENFMNPLLSIIRGVIFLVIAALIAGVTCGIVRQLAYFDIAKNRKGAINQILERIYEAIQSWKNQGPHTAKHFLEGESRMKSNKALNLIGAMNFATNDQFEAISLGINSILGSISSSNGYGGKLTVNELIDIALSSTSGNLEFGDLKGKLAAGTYPSMSFDGPVFRPTITLKSLSLSGLNTFNAFNFLVNGFGNNPWPNQDYGKPSGISHYEYTFVNALEMGSFGLVADIQLTLCDGYWVTVRPRYSNPCIQLQFPMKLSLESFKGNLAITTAFITNRFLSLVIGSVIGKIDKFVDRLRCLATALEWFEFGGIRMSIDNIPNFSVQGYDGPLKITIENGISAFNKLFKGTMKNYLPVITDHWVRRRLNEYIQTKILASGNKNCPVLNSNSGPRWTYFYKDDDEGRFINFQTSKIWDGITSALNNIIGGNPVKKSSGDVNKFIQMYLDYYLPEILPETVIRKISYGNWAIEQISSHPPIHIDINSYSIRIDQLALNNTHSIHVLTTKDAGPYTFEINAKIGNGKLYDSSSKSYELRGPIGMSFRFTSSVRVALEEGSTPVGMANDTIRVFIGFSNITFFTRVTTKLNQNDFLRLRWRDLTKFPCLLAVVDSKNMDDLILGFESIDLRLSFEKTPSSTELGDALTSLQNEMVQWGPSVSAMLRFFFKGIAQDIKAAFNAFTAINGAVDGCDTRKSPFSSNAITKVIDFIFKYEDIVKYYLAATNDVSNPRLTMSAYEVEQDIPYTNTYFKITENPIIKEIGNVFSDASKAQDILRSIARSKIADFFKSYNFTELCGSYAFVCSSAIKLVDALYIEPDGVKVSIDIDLQDLGVPYIGSSRYIPGFKFIPGRLKITNLISINEITLFKRFKEESLFTFEHTLSWSKSSSIDFDFDFTIQVNKEFVGQAPPNLRRPKLLSLMRIII